MTPGRWVQTLVVDQRRAGEGWEVQIVWVDDQGRAITEWKPADQLQPYVAEHPHLGTAYG